VAKNKLKCQKSRNVFHITSHKNSKAKNKAKRTTTHLKKINVMKDEKDNRMNRTFVNIQKELANFLKSLSLKSMQKEPRHHEREPANVGKATRLIVTNTLLTFRAAFGGRTMPTTVKDKLGVSESLTNLGY
ncbi:Ribosomal biogenesis factor, partial [Lemmus lemmus]